ncbi:ethylbenzene dehydrogenase [Sinobacterium caligoides]|uniref:Ethylbenzene dehydrogenase n=2 Tax=Sinobacterium caligoides TaxID=933926 RepID=A0A3N2E088_9GAMM|nr:ethylbenzene dehydrogenase [Sinobacterium caligoides]
MINNNKSLWAVLHLVAITCILISLLTGLRIAILDHDYLLAISDWLPQGEMHSWHFLSGLVFSLTAVVYAYLRYSKRLISRPSNSSATTLEKYHKLINRLLYIICVLSIISGSLLYSENIALASIDLLLIHYLLALAFIGYIFAHGVVYLLTFGCSTLQHILSPLMQLRKKQVIILSVMTLTIIAVSYTLKATSAHSLVFKRIAEDVAITIDGKADEAIWQQAKSLTVYSHGSRGASTTPITVKALHNGQDAFFLIQWPDTTESLQHLPLEKTAQGWQVKENGFQHFDEQQYYEDKLAMMIANNCDFAAAGSAHLGPKPLEDKPQNWSGKGYHYVEKGLVDLWHWKAVRSNNMRLMDDNYIGPPDILRAGLRRYTAGYHPDASESGVYRMNWQWYSPEGITPKRLPIATANSASEQETVMRWYDSRPYQAENDQYPVGSILPSVLYTSNQIEGDRANVRAFGVWQDGQWSLEVFRPLNTGSSHDLAINDGVCLWLAAFDHVQIAHSRHNRPIRARLEK